MYLLMKLLEKGKLLLILFETPALFQFAEEWTEVQKPFVIWFCEW